MMAKISGQWKGPAQLPEPEWFRAVARKIVREGKNFLLAIDELGIPGLTSKEAEEIHRSNTFQTVLRNERLKFATEYARDPALSRDAAIGMMMIGIEKLMLEGEWDKAIDGLTKLSKLTGWLGADQNVNVFADLKQKDLEEMRKQIESGKGKSRDIPSLN